MRDKWKVVAAGFALFSMFFGAGDLLWPLILGAQTGHQSYWAVTGLILTGVSLPLLGLVAMVLFDGDYHAFFHRLGSWQGALALFIIQAILGPFGSLPRLITLCYGTLKPYIPELSLTPFSLIACLVIFLLSWKRSRIVAIVGLGLTPILLTSLIAIFYYGFQSPPLPFTAQNLSEYGAFSRGISVGYNTLDLIASFLFAPVILTYFSSEGDDSQKNNHVRLKLMLKACLIAAVMLSLMFLGLCSLASRYAPLLTEDLLPEEMLGAISKLLLGEKGALISTIAIIMACLTTAIPLVSIAGDYVKYDLCKGQCNRLLSLTIPILIAGLLANLGFAGIAKMLDPILKVICPILLILSLLNISYKLNLFKSQKIQQGKQLQ